MHIVLFGGSFDPPHTGHTTIVQEMLRRHRADEVWYVPCAHHPFDKSMSLTKHRVSMLQCVIQPHTSIYTYEVEHQEKSYSLNTLRAATQQYPYQKFSWLIGSDNLAHFHQWKDYKTLLKEFQVFVYPRKGFPFTPLYQHMIALETFPEVEVSSTLVRTSVQHRKSIDTLVPPSVATYISQHDLYKNPKLLA